MIDFLSLGYWGLFLASFLAATVLPFSSEVVFSALVFSGGDAWTSVIVATLGNWLGGMSCYYIGTLGKLDWIERYFKIKKASIDKFAGKIHKYGDWFAFFSFLPGIGDVIAVASGFFRCNIWIVAISMLIGKFVRYVAWLYLHNLIL